MITIGIVVAYCVDLAFVSSNRWQAMFAFGLAPAAALLVAMARSPETPAWLDAHGHGDEARRVIEQVADEEEAERVLESFRRLRQENKRRARVHELLESASRPALITGATLAVLQQSPHARATGASVSSATNWFSNCVVSLGFLPVVAAIAQGQTFWIFAIVCALVLVFVLRYVPETDGRSFAEIDAEVRSRWQSVRPRAATAY
jgi:sugar transport protein